MQTWQYKSKPKIIKDAYEQHVAKHKERMQAMAPPPGQMGPPQVGGGKPPEQMGAPSALPDPGAVMDKLLTSARSG